MVAEGRGTDRAGGEQVVEHIVAGRAVLGAVPTQTKVIAERFFDESGGMVVGDSCAVWRDG